MKVSKIINKVRTKTQDFNETKFSEYEVLFAINEANKAFRIVCMQELPNIISEELNGTLESGENTIPTTASKVLKVVVNDKELRQSKCNGFEIGYNDGIVIKIYPVPDKPVNYVVEVVSDVVELKQDDEIKLPDECIAFIIDVAVNMLTGGDAITQSALEDKLRYILGNFAPSSPFVKSYY